MKDINFDIANENSRSIGKMIDGKFATALKFLMALIFLIASTVYALAAGYDMSLVDKIFLTFLYMFILAVFGAAFAFLDLKYLILLLMAGWLAAFVLILFDYGVAGAISRGGSASLMLLVVTVPVAAGWWLARLANRDMSGD